MKVEIYGPYPYETEHLIALLGLIPESAKHVVVQAPRRRSADLKLCQRPSILEYAASVDNKSVIHYSNGPLHGTVVKFTS